MEVKEIMIKEVGTIGEKENLETALKKNCQRR
jgi:hypothetical protein